MSVDPYRTDKNGLVRSNISDQFILWCIIRLYKIFIFKITFDISVLILCLKGGDSLGKTDSLDIDSFSLRLLYIGFPVFFIYTRLLHLNSLNFTTVYIAVSIL